MGAYMNQAQRVVDANVHLHAKMPFVALPGLVHFRIALAGAVLGGAGRRNNGGIGDAAFTQHQAVLLHVFVHLFKQCLAKTVLLQEMPESAAWTQSRTEHLPSPGRSGYRTAACSGLAAWQTADTEVVRSGPWGNNGLPSFQIASRESASPSAPGRSRDESCASWSGTRLWRM